MTQEDLEHHEAGLTRALAAWAVGSVVVGGALGLAGRARGRPELAAFGRQTAAWGAVDALIAAMGAASRHRRGRLVDDEIARQAARLRTLLMVNAGADVGYVLGGAIIAVRGRDGRTTARLRRGDGLAIVVQGAFLLALDATYARRLP